jgi:hypothetical protein
MAAFLPDLPVKVTLLEVTANLDKRSLAVEDASIVTLVFPLNCGLGSELPEPHPVKNIIGTTTINSKKMSVSTPRHLRRTGDGFLLAYLKAVIIRKRQPEVGKRPCRIADRLCHYVKCRAEKNFLSCVN